MNQIFSMKEIRPLHRDRRFGDIRGDAVTVLLDARPRDFA
jgi:hypothetical protein